MKKFFWILCMSSVITSRSFAQIGWWTSSDTLNVFNKNKGAVLIGSYQPLGKLTVGPDDKFYNLSLVGDYNNLAKNYLQIGVTGRGFENLQGQTIFDLYHSNTQFRNAGYNFRINGQSQFFINGEGNIGIGTEKPEAKLDLTGGPNWGGFTKALRVPGEHAIKFESNGSEYGMVATGGMLNFVTSNQNESTNPFGVPFSRIMSLQRNKVVIEGDIEVKGKIYSQGQVGGGGDIPVDNGGGGSGDGGGGGGDKGDGGILPTIAPYGSGAQDWVMNGNNIYYTYNNGKVGIGIANPDNTLHVNGGIFVGANQTSYTGGPGGSGSINFKTATTDYVYIKGEGAGSDDGGLLFMGGDDVGTYFRFNNSVTGELMRITGNGNVGIGTTSPGAKLHVSGNILQDNGGSNVFQAKNSSGSIETWMWPRWSDNVMYTNFGSGGWNIRNNTSVNVMYLTNGGSVGIGTTNPGTDKLAVNGTIRAKELYLTTTGWSDFVFEPGYNLRTLLQVENFIKKNGHLPEIPSQKEVEEKGVGVIDMQSKLLQKIEELTLYLIEQNKKNEEQNKRIQELEERLKGRK